MFVIQSRRNSSFLFLLIDSNLVFPIYTFFFQSDRCFIVCVFSRVSKQNRTEKQETLSNEREKARPREKEREEANRRSRTKRRSTGIGTRSIDLLIIPAITVLRKEQQSFLPFFFCVFRSVVRMRS